MIFEERTTEMKRPKRSNRERELEDKIDQLIESNNTLEEALKRERELREILEDKIGDLSEELEERDQTPPPTKP